MTSNSRRYVRWTDAEDEFLRENYEDMTDEELADELGRSAGAIYIRRYENGWTRDKPVKKSSSDDKPLNHGQPWDDQDELFLREHFEDLSDKRLGEKLGRTAKAVELKRNELGLSRWDSSDSDESGGSSDEVEYSVECSGDTVLISAERFSRLVRMLPDVEVSGENVELKRETWSALTELLSKEQLAELLVEGGE